MPTLDWNLKQWEARQAWSDRGDEWSEAWGSADMQWYGSLLPRLHRFLPAQNILEIAPGYGRWTSHLLEHCQQLFAVDLSPSCIEHCRKRFDGHENARLFVNDGTSLPMIADQSIDLVFSFDSLVHADAEVIAPYLQEIHRVLRPDGVAFIHHSNLGEYARYFKTFTRVKNWLMKTTARSAGPPDSPATADNVTNTELTHLYFRVRETMGLDSDHSRSLSMTADRFSDIARAAGLRCMVQEKINWATRRTIDCLSLVTRQDSSWQGNTRWRNAGFMREAATIKGLSRVYDAVNRAGPGPHE